MHFVMIFLDGFGLGSEENNPIVTARTPNIDHLLGGHLIWGDRSIVRGQARLTPLEATLGVHGIPQSATGQTTLWTGVNASKVLGYHLNAYPNDKLAHVIAEKSIFKQLVDRGQQGMFANTFTPQYEQLVASGKKRHSASTLSAMAGRVKLRRIPDLRAGRAVYYDMTNQVPREMGEDVPLISAEQAGQNLGRLALGYDFTLYEMFLTDVFGHKQRWEESVQLIEQIDEFLGGFLRVIQNEDVAWLLTSDHGNIEDFAIKGHTQNRVPALSWSNRPIEWPRWTTLEDVTPGILELLS
ncbi:metalloenzyme [Desulfitobacterium metallireducens]|uniref:Metalloenzyme domain protein n=1 Tax=Desulfitobacterium metallireducens DSM 15288 TaxID=871968 RepID=W0E4K2_9FIRM|nr:metalloenzyme [Desulfitobacterium metallireducens]AHF05770.1 metalloenzyme domain protein [Desulfitobacterium metallireducens DSM 15288]